MGNNPPRQVYENEATRRKALLRMGLKGLWHGFWAMFAILTISFGKRYFRSGAIDALSIFENSGTYFTVCWSWAAFAFGSFMAQGGLRTRIASNPN